MTRVFVSHSAADAEHADRLRQAIDRHDADHVVHFSSRPDSGAGTGDWRSWIRRTIQSCDLVVFIASEDALASTWCTAELGMACLLRTPVLGLYLGDEPLASPLVDGRNALPLSFAESRIGSLIEQVVGASGAAAPLAPGESPYPGLAPLSEAQQGVLFGRGRELSRVLGAFDLPRPIVVLTGPSGSGKSSLLRAGVVPRLRRDGWTVVGPVQPRDLATDVTSLDARADDGSPRVVLVDQSEELGELHDEDRSRVVARVGDRLAAGDHVLLAVRSEFRAAVDLWDVATTDHYVPFLSVEALHDVIRGPARAAALEVPEELVDRLVVETGSGSALPLLALTLRLLWEQRDREHHRLRMATLDELGGVQGVLEGQATAALHAATGGAAAREDDVLRVLSRLASPAQIPPTRAPKRVRTMGDDERRWIDEFNQRGLVAYRTSYALEDNLTPGVAPTGEDLVDVTHEALFEWDPLSRTINAQRRRNHHLDAVEAAAAEWDRGDRQDRTMLVAGDRLATARELRRGAADPVVRDFVRASERADRDRTARRVLSIVAAVAAVAAIAAAVFFVGERNRAIAAEEQAEAARRDEASARQEAEAARVVAQSVRVASQASQAIEAERDFALLAAVAGWRIDRNPDTEGALVDVLATPEGPVRWFAEPGVDWSTLEAMTPSHGAVVDGDRQPALVDLDSGSVTARPVESAAVPGGSSVVVDDVVSAGDGRMVVVRGRVVPTGDMVGWVDVRADAAAIIVGHDVPITAVAGSIDHLVFGDLDGTVLDVSRPITGPPGEVRTIADLGGEVLDLARSSDGEWLAATTVEGVFVLHRNSEGWTAPERMAVPDADGRSTSKVAFGSGASVRLFAAGSDPTLRQWRADDGELVEGRPLGMHGSVVRDLVATPDGMLVTAGFDGSLQRWSTTTDAPVGDPLRAHDTPVGRVSAVGDGRVVSTAREGAEGQPEAVLWDLRPWRAVEQAGAIPDAWQAEEVAALVEGAGPLGVVTAAGEALDTAGSRGTVPMPTQRASWVAGGGLVVEQGTRTDGQLDQPPLWVWETGPAIQHPGSGADGAVGYEAVHVGSCLAAAAHGQVVEFLEVADCGQPPEALTLPAGEVRELALNEDETRLLVVRRDRNRAVQVVEEWDHVAAARERAVDLPGVTATAARWLDTDRVAVGRDVGAPSVVLDLSGDQEPLPVGSHDDAVWWLAWDERRNQLWTAGQDGRLTQTDLSTGRVVGGPRLGARSRALNDVDAAVRGLRLDAEAGMLLAIHGRRLVAWEVDPERLAEQACAFADRDLTAAERRRLDLPDALVVCG